MHLRGGARGGNALAEGERVSGNKLSRMVVIEKIDSVYFKEI